MALTKETFEDIRKRVVDANQALGHVHSETQKILKGSQTLKHHFI